MTDQTSGSTCVHGEVARATAHLAASGVDNAGNDASWLAAYVLGLRRWPLVHAGQFTATQLATYRSLVAERAARVPLQHLTGQAGFRHLVLSVGRGVFIPRPETELLVSWGLDELARRAVAHPIVVDLCAGSGAIALSVAGEHPSAQVYAVERDPAAREWLARNAADRRAAGDRPIEVCAGDVADAGLLAPLHGRVDLVLCNPPYLLAGGVVPPEVDHDPAPALYGGADGLAVIRQVVDRATVLLRAGGALGIEHGDAQGEAALELIGATGGFADLADHPDLAGRDRFTTGRRLAD